MRLKYWITACAVIVGAGAFIVNISEDKEASLASPVVRTAKPLVRQFMILMRISLSTLKTCIRNNSVPQHQN